MTNAINKGLIEISLDNGNKQKVDEAEDKLLNLYTLMRLWQQ